MRKAAHAQIEILTYVIYIANLNLHDKREAHSLRTLANYLYVQWVSMVFLYLNIYDLSGGGIRTRPRYVGRWRPNAAASCRAVAAASCRVVAAAECGRAMSGTGGRIMSGGGGRTMSGCPNYNGPR